MNVLFAAGGNVEEYISRQKYKAKFTELKSNPDIGPKIRKHAAYAFDEKRQLIYMFGGCDDASEYNDLWSFDVSRHEWKEIETVNGPSARFGSKMIYDPAGNQLFVLGRYNKADQVLKVGGNCMNIQIEHAKGGHLFKRGKENGI